MDLIIGENIINQCINAFPFEMYLFTFSKHPLIDGLIGVPQHSVKVAGSLHFLTTLIPFK